MGLTSFLGRVMVAAIFILAGVNKFQQTDSSVQYFQAKYPVFHKELEKLAKPYFPLPQELSPKFLQPFGTQIIQAVGGAEVFFGLLVVLNSGCAACILALMTIGFNLIMHNPWLVSQDEKMGEMMQFLKNLGLIGALWLVGSCQICKKPAPVDDQAAKGKKKKNKKD